MREEREHEPDPEHERGSEGEPERQALLPLSIRAQGASSRAYASDFPAGV
jgi:hypothetical protein